MQPGHAFQLVDQKPSVILVSRACASLDLDAITKYHGSIHPGDAHLIRTLITRGYHIIGAIKWNSQQLLSGIFRPNGGDDRNCNHPTGPGSAQSQSHPEDDDLAPLSMHLFTAKLRWTVLE